MNGYIAQVGMDVHAARKARMRRLSYEWLTPKRVKRCLQTGIYLSDGTATTKGCSYGSLLCAHGPSRHISMNLPKGTM